MAFSWSSFFEPITVTSPHLSHFQKGKANPQYLFFEINQSCILLSQSSSRSKPKSGIQVIFLTTSIISCLKVRFCLSLGSFRSIEIYHSSTSLKTSSSLHLQQVG